MRGGYIYVGYDRDTRKWEERYLRASSNRVRDTLVLCRTSVEVVRETKSIRNRLVQKVGFLE